MWLMSLSRELPTTTTMISPSIMSRVQLIAILVQLKLAVIPSEQRR
jgi:hypothetical protein